MSVTRRATEMTDDERWAGLDDWLTHSEERRRRLAKRQLLYVGRDLHPTEVASAVRFDEALDAWESDRSLLLWAFNHTPATTLGVLRVKARAVQAFLGRPDALRPLSGPKEITPANLSPPVVELAAAIVRDLLTMQEPAPAQAA